MRNSTLPARTDRHFVNGLLPPGGETRAPSSPKNAFSLFGMGCNEPSGGQPSFSVRLSGVFPFSNRGSFCKPLLQPCPLFDPPEARSGCRGRPSPRQLPVVTGRRSGQGMQPLAARASARVP